MRKLLTEIRGRKHSSRYLNQRQGAVALEFALVAPIVFMFVLGIVEVGRGFMVTHQLENAARRGCREGVLDGSSTGAIKTVVTDVLKAQGISQANTTVLVNGAETEASAAKSSDRITVHVTIPVSEFTWLPGGAYLQGSLGGKYTLRRE